jgi:hypothetical protein
MADKEASNIDFDALAYAAIKGYSHEHQELRPSRKGSADADYAGTKTDSWTAFTMVQHWPKVRLLIDFDKEGGDDVEWFMERVSDADDRVAMITFYSKPMALVDAEVIKIRDHAKKLGNAKEFKGLTTYQRVSRMIDDYDRHRKSVAAQSRADKQEAERLARKADKYPPKKGSDEQRVMLTAKGAWQVKVEYRSAGELSSSIHADSSAKAVLSKLRDPDFVLVGYEERRRNGGEELPEGTVAVFAEFCRHDDEFQYTHYTYLSGPSAKLIEQLELAETRDPKTAPRTMKTRRDTI